MADVGSTKPGIPVRPTGLYISTFTPFYSQSVAAATPTDIRDNAQRPLRQNLVDLAPWGNRGNTLER